MIVVHKGFKALSRMSSSPTSTEPSSSASSAVSFQSAVAHELLSDLERSWKYKEAFEGFKALSRMSSSPT